MKNPSQKQGWAGLKNGDLLRHAEAAGFEIFLTSDQNLEFQQNLERSGLVVVVLAADSNALEANTSRLRLSPL